jgi:hypothetical protein
MKNLIFKALTFIILSLSLTSCEDPGVTDQRLYGTEQNLPEELKGLKVYRVSTGSGDYIKVAILNGEVNSTTYKVGKHTESTIIIDKEGGKIIEVSQVLMENDSLIVCRK